MKRRILLWGGVLFVIAITNSCSFFKKLASTDLETEEDFILEEISKEVPRPAPKPTVKPQNKKNKITLHIIFTQFSNKIFPVYSIILTRRRNITKILLLFLLSRKDSNPH